jgi:hypothetical protein
MQKQNRDREMVCENHSEGTAPFGRGSATSIRSRDRRERLRVVFTQTREEAAGFQ